MIPPTINLLVVVYCMFIWYVMICRIITLTCYSYFV